MGTEKNTLKDQTSNQQQPEDPQARYNVTVEENQPDPTIAPPTDTTTETQTETQRKTVEQQKGQRRG